MQRAAAGVGWVSPAVAITRRSRGRGSHTLYWHKLLPFLADWNAGYASGVRPKAPASDESASTQRARSSRDAARPSAARRDRPRVVVEPFPPWGRRRRGRRGGAACGRRRAPGRWAGGRRGTSRTSGGRGGSAAPTRPDVRHHELLEEAAARVDHERRHRRAERRLQLRLDVAQVLGVADLEDGVAAPQPRRGGGVFGIGSLSTKANGRACSSGAQVLGRLLSAVAIGRRSRAPRVSRRRARVRVHQRAVRLLHPAVHFARVRVARVLRDAT